MKITRKIFNEALRKNLGLYSRTARYLSKEYNIKISRQAVRIRALKNPELVAEVAEEAVDFAEETLFDLMHSRNEGVKFRAVELFLKTKGRSRGYQTNVDLNIDFERLSDDQLQTIVDSLLQKIQS